MIRFIKRFLARRRLSPRDRPVCDVMDAIHALTEANLLLADKIHDLREMRDYIDSWINLIQQPPRQL